MADNSTIARPYAKAVFELAHADGSLQQWGSLLKAIAGSIDDQVLELLADPRVGSDQVGQVIIEALGDRVDGNGRNFIRLLAENDRIGALPEITAAFEALRAEAEHTIDVNVTSAAPMSEQHQQQLAAALQRKLGREVRLHCDVDESLIGGAVVRAGDLVIDSSLRARLKKLATNLNS